MGSRQPVPVEDVGMVGNMMGREGKPLLSGMSEEREEPG